jgi:hypothetical protein
MELVEVSIGAMLTDESDLPAFPLRMLELLKQVLPYGAKDIHHHKGRITNACGATVPREDSACVEEVQQFSGF